MRRGLILMALVAAIPAWSAEPTPADPFGMKAYEFNGAIAGFQTKEPYCALAINAGDPFGGAMICIRPNGEVKVPDGMNITDAAERFWNAVAQVRGQPAPFPDAPH